MIGTAGIIICEQRGGWARVLRKVLAAEEVCLQETRSWTACREALTARPASLVVLELTAGNSPLLVERLLDLPRQFPLARAVVVGERECQRYEWALREAGAAAVVFSSRQLAGVARLILRHLALAPVPPLTLREAIWQRLPWRRVASADDSARP